MRLKSLPKPDDHLGERQLRTLHLASHKALAIAPYFMLAGSLLLNVAGEYVASLVLVGSYMMLLILQRWYVSRLKMGDEFEDALTKAARQPASRWTTIGTIAFSLGIALLFELDDWNGWSSILTASVLAASVSAGVMVAQTIHRRRRTTDEIETDEPSTITER